MLEARGHAPTLTAYHSTMRRVCVCSPLSSMRVVLRFLYYSMHSNDVLGGSACDTSQMQSPLFSAAARVRLRLLGAETAASLVSTLHVWS